MNKISLTTIILFFSGLLFSQTYNRWSVSAAFGNHFGMKPTTNKTRFYQPQSIQLGGRFMANQYIGVMLNLGYDFLDSEGNGVRNQHLVKTSLQGVINIGGICNFQRRVDWFGILFHTGISATHLISPSDKRADARDPLFKNVDDIFGLVVGLTPQFKLSNRLTLFFDYSFQMNFMQDMSYDFNTKIAKNARTGYLSNLFVGLRVNLGKYKEHADWNANLIN